MVTIKGCYSYNLIGGLLTYSLNLCPELVFCSRGWYSSSVVVWVVLFLGYGFSYKSGKVSRWMGALYPINVNVVSSF